MVALLGFLVPVAHVAAADEDVIISHGDTSVTVFDVRQLVNTQVPPEQRPQLYANEKKLRETIGSMFTRAKLAEYAGKRELNAVEQWRVDQAVRDVLSQIEIERQVAESGVPDVSKFVEEVYIGSPDRFRVPGAVRAQHVLISNEKRSDEEALALANRVKALADEGRPFDEIAVEFSEDQSVKQNRGDLGFFSKGQMVKPFEDAAFALTSIGEVVGPVKSQFGYHVIRLVERRDERIRSLEEVRPMLEREELSRYRNRVLNELIGKIATLEGVEINNQVLETLIVRSPAVPAESRRAPAAAKQ